MTLEEMRRERGALSALPRTESRSARTRALLRRAEAAGHTSLALSPRLDLLDLEDLLVGRTAPEDRGPRSDRMRVDFTHILALHDHGPEHFGADEESLLWHVVNRFVGDLLERAAAPVTHLTALLDDLERRFSPTGANLTTFLAARRHIANHVGDLDTAAALADGVPRAIGVADLYEDQAEHAMRFALRADECNGNDFRSRLVHEHIHQRPVVAYLDLGTERTPVPPTEPESPR